MSREKNLIRRLKTKSSFVWLVSNQIDQFVSGCWVGNWLRRLRIANDKTTYTFYSYMIFQNRLKTQREEKAHIYLTEQDNLSTKKQTNHGA